jgi:hypothetical protein
MIAVTHHLLIRLAAERVGVYNFDKYIVLGDDVVIASTQVALSYKSLITRIGVGISGTKSISPCGRHLSAEFASKLVLNGINVSPLPLGLLLEGRFTSLIELVSHILDTQMALVRNIDVAENTPPTVEPLSRTFSAFLLPSIPLWDTELLGKLLSKQQRPVSEEWISL